MMIVLCIAGYLILSIVTYFFLDKFLPYDPNDDPFGDGDTNKPMSIFWPFTWIAFVALLMWLVPSKVFHVIHDVNEVTRHKSKKEQEIIICSECGTVIRKENYFCPNCGKKQVEDNV